MRLAVCAEMVFTDLPFTERVRRIHNAGFDVELWDSRTKDLKALKATGAVFSSMTGYTAGSLVDPDTADDVVRTAATLIPTALELGVSRLVVHSAARGPDRRSSSRTTRPRNWWTGRPHVPCSGPPAACGAPGPGPWNASASWGRSTS